MKSVIDTLFAIAVMLLLAAIASGQDRIFHASPIDQQQNSRLDTIESRQTLYEAVTAARLAALEQATPKPPEAEKAVSEEPKALPQRSRIAVDPLTGVEVFKSAIIMISSNRCHYCDEWWSLFPEALRDKDWQVEKVIGNFDGVERFPTFRIYANGKWIQSQGFMSMDQLRILIGLPAQETVVITQPIAVSGRYSTEELRGQINSLRPGGWNGPVYADVQPRSQAKNHLIGPEHGFSWDQVSGLSQSEALILHDLAPGHGNQIQPYRSGNAPAKRSVARMVAESSGCPNGDCSRAVRRRSSWFFR